MFRYTLCTALSDVGVDSDGVQPIRPDVGELTVVRRGRTKNDWVGDWYPAAPEDAPACADVEPWACLSAAYSGYCDDPA